MGLLERWLTDLSEGSGWRHLGGECRVERREPRTQPCGKLTMAKAEQTGGTLERHLPGTTLSSYVLSYLSLTLLQGIL